MLVRPVLEPGLFYRGGHSVTPTLPPAMASPSTPLASGHHMQTININQKLYLVLSMIMEQKKATEETREELAGEILFHSHGDKVIEAQDAGCRWAA